jgi:hypothetical protein
MKWTLLFCLLVTCTQLNAQTIRGTVSDADTGQPLVGATVALNENQGGTTTDSTGLFRFTGLEIGRRYQLTVSFLGYAPVVLTEILVESGKEQLFDITLSQTNAELATVTVRGRQSEGRWYLPSVKVLTMEETMRFPATFFDPARLTFAYPGVIGDNDQTNGISVRGNSPNHLRWRLEGVDIVNPNHTPNAGTFSDRVTQSGGGVNILSAQLLGTTRFYTGAFPVEFGDALGGVLDMHLRPGNNERREWTLQAGLIGVDLAAEGPLNKAKGSSYLVNYRYSTVGLLQALGMELGDEAINFQDLSFNLAFPLQNGGEVTVFGLGGISTNVFEAQRDSTLWEFSKDRFDIDFSSRMGALGATLQLPAGRNGLWKTSFAASGLESTRTGERLDDSYNPILAEEDELNQSKLSLHSFYQLKWNPQNRLRVGLVLTQMGYNLTSRLANEVIASGNTGGALWQPYFDWQNNLAPNLDLNAGLHFTYFGLNGSNAVEPRVSLDWRQARHRISLAYGLHSQTQAPQLYFAQTEPANDNKDLDLTKAHHLGLGYQYELSNTRQLEFELFYQHLFDVPVTVSPSSFSALNLVEQFVTVPLVNQGEGRNYGLSVNYQQQIQQGLYYLINGTVFQSKYTGSDGQERDTRFNAGMIANATLGKEWTRRKDNGKIKVTGFNGRLTYSGGFRDTPIDAAASAQAGRTIYREDQAFSLQQPAYYRLDLRLYLKWNKPGRHNTLSLDIQNATNRENTAFSYYDTQAGQIVEKKQLGIIPIINYRMEFGGK